MELLEDVKFCFDRIFFISTDLDDPCNKLVNWFRCSKKSYHLGLLPPHLVLSCRCRCHLILTALASLLKSSPLSLPFFSCSLLASLIPTRSLSKTCMLSRWANLHQIHIIRCNSVLQTCQGDLSEFSSAVAPTASLAGEVFAPASGWSKTSPNLIPNCCWSPA